MKTEQQVLKIPFKAEITTSDMENIKIPFWITESFNVIFDYDKVKGINHPFFKKLKRYTPYTDITFCDTAIKMNGTILTLNYTNGIY
jgi:hypothetical protein